MTLSEHLKLLHEQYRIQIIDLDPWHDQPIYKQSLWLEKQLLTVYKRKYELDERVVFTLSRNNKKLIENLQQQLNQIDISNFFVIMLINSSIKDVEQIQKNVSLDPVSITVITYIDKTAYSYNSADPVKVALADLSSDQQALLTKSSTFCMYPWIHLHAYPTGQAYPCCQADMKYPIGNCRTSTLKEIWNDDPMKEVRSFSDTAAIVEELDAVIAVDASVAHVAGMLRKPAWVVIDDVLNSLDAHMLQRVTEIFNTDLRGTGVIHIGTAMDPGQLFNRVLHLARDPAGPGSNARPG